MEPIVQFEESIYINVNNQDAKGQGAVVLPVPPCMWIYRR